MAVNGIGNGYFYPVKNQETVGMKASDSKPSSRTVVNNGGVSYEKSISDAASSGLDFIQEVEKRNSGTKFFVLQKVLLKKELYQVEELLI